MTMREWQDTRVTTSQSEEIDETATKIAAILEASGMNQFRAAQTLIWANAKFAMMERTIS